MEKTVYQFNLMMDGEAFKLLRDSLNSSYRYFEKMAVSPKRSQAVRDDATRRAARIADLLIALDQQHRMINTMPGVQS